jgi:hypothetical protein
VHRRVLGEGDPIHLDEALLAGELHQQAERGIIDTVQRAISVSFMSSRATDIGSYQSRWILSR